MVRVGWRGALVVPVAIGVLAVSACSGGGSGGHPAAQLIVEATSGADSAHFDTTVDIDNPGGYRVESTGAVDFTHHRGTITVHAMPASATSSSVGSSDIRWIGDDVYFRGIGVNAADAGSRWRLVNAARFQAGGACLAKRDVVLALGRAGIEDPASLLDTLRTRNIHLERAGTETIRGVTTTHWRAAPRDWPVRSPCVKPTDSRHTTVRVGVEVWTDAHDRALRLHLSQTQTTTYVEDEPSGLGPHTTHNVKRTDVQKTNTTTDFSDFGSAVNVQRPAAGQAVDETAAYVSLALGPGSIKASDWRNAMHGEIAGKPWTIYAGVSDTGWHCFDSTDTPQSDQSGITLESNGLPQHDGHISDCDIEGGLLGFEGPAHIFVNTTDHGVRTIVGAAPAPGDTRLELADGASQPIAVDPHTWMFEWSGKPAPAPIRLHIGAHACRVDGKGRIVPQTNSEATGNAPCNGASPGDPVLSPG